MKNTKRSLFFSITALILCCALLAGTTMAWFTDSVSSGVNTITAGNLDIEVLHTNANVTTPETIDGKTGLFQGLDGNEMKWEPGAVTYETFTVKNAGTLALKYNLKLNITDYNAVSGTNKTLKDVLKVKVLTGRDILDNIDRNTVTSLDWSTVTESLETFQYSNQRLLPSGTTEEKFQVIVYWQPSDADNEWNVNNGKTTTDGRPLFINFGINVVAAQLNHESDSFGPDYDQGIALPDLPVSVNKTFQSAPITGNNVMESVVVKNVSTNKGVATVQAESVNAVIDALTAQATDKADDSDLSTVIYLDVQTAGKTETSVTYEIGMSATLTYTDTNGDSKETTLTNLNGNLAGKIVTATMEIGKGLSNVTVKHHDTPMTQLASANTDAEGYYYDKTTGVLTIKSKSFSPFTVDYTIEGVAAVGDTTYSTLEEAFNAANDGDTVVLLKNIEASSVIQINKNLTLDLNGKTVTNSKSQSRPLQIADCTVTVKNGSIVIPETNTSSYGLIEIKALNANVNVTLDRVTLNGNTDNGALVRIQTVNEDKVGTLSMNNVNSSTNYKVQSTESLVGEVHLNVTGGTYVADGRVFCADSYVSSSTANFTNVTATSDLGPVIELDTVVGTFANCNFNVTNLKQPETWYSVAVGLGYDAIANIESGTYTSEKAAAIEVYTSGGTFNISGGTFSGVNAIKTYNDEESIINISGGVFTGALDIANEKTNAAITGGTFSTDPSEYVADNKMAVQGTDGRWTIEDPPASWAFVTNETEFNTALAKATIDRIIIKNDIVFNSKKSIARAVTVDLGANKLTTAEKDGSYSASVFEVQYNGNLSLLGKGGSLIKSGNVINAQYQEGNPTIKVYSPGKLSIDGVNVEGHNMTAKEVGSSCTAGEAIEVTQKMGDTNRGALKINNATVQSGVIPETEQRSGFGNTLSVGGYVDVTLTNCTFSAGYTHQNTYPATVKLGGSNTVVYMENCTVTAPDLYFPQYGDDHRATAGIYNAGSKMTLIDCSVYGKNNNSYSQGAISINGTCEMYFKDTIVQADGNSTNSYDISITSSSARPTFYVAGTDNISSLRFYKGNYVTIVPWAE